VSNGFDWSLIQPIGIGLGVLCVGAGVMIALIALAKTLGRVNATLDEVDRQIAGLGTPVGETLAHIEGIAGTAEESLARLGQAAASLETAAGTVSSTTTLTKSALEPAIVNVGATLAGITAGLRRLVTGKDSSGRS
jgi:ABC-type transporter Mla subunit MlaD